MAKLDWVRKIYEDGMHCAFTGMAKWKGGYYVSFRHAEQHDDVPYGDTFVIRSGNLEDWHVCGKITTGQDDRDPTLVAAGNCLFLYVGSAHTETAFVDDELTKVEGKGWLETCASYTEDGESWRTPVPVYKRGHFLWHLYRFEDGFYSACKCGGFLRSDDGLNWEQISHFPQGVFGETALARLDDGCIVGAVRHRGSRQMISFVEAAPPYEEWSHWYARHRMSGPELAVIGGRIIGAGRTNAPFDDTGKKTVTTVHEIDIANRRTTPLVDLPSGGDTGYPGMVVEDNRTLLICYYSQHEYFDKEKGRYPTKPASIYLARLSFG